MVEVQGLQAPVELLLVAVMVVVVVVWEIVVGLVPVVVAVELMETLAAEVEPLCAPANAQRHPRAQSHQCQQYLQVLPLVEIYWRRSA